MQITFNPRVTGKFVRYILKNPRLQDYIKDLQDCGWSEEDVHNLFKSILIAGFTEFTVDINNDIINAAKRQAVDAG